MKQNPQVLGAEEMISGFRLQGDPSPPDLVNILLKVIEAVKMEPDGCPDVRFYPNGHGKGGHGAQIYQPLTESWIIGGTWPLLGYTRIVLSSCKPYDVGKVAALLEESIGPIIMQFVQDL